MLLLNNFSDFFPFGINHSDFPLTSSFKIKLSINSFTVYAIQMEFPLTLEL